MKTIAISEFKAQALKVINEIARSGEPVVITKRGRPLALVVPVQKSETKAAPGKLAAAFVFEKDMVTPLGPELMGSQPVNY